MTEIISIYDSPYSVGRTGATSAIAGFQAAIDSVETTGGGVVSFRAGFPNIDNQLTLKKHVITRGAANSLIPMRQATADSDGISGGLPNTALKITRTSIGSTNADSATFLINSNSGGMHNTLISYPNQVISGATPIMYNPVFGSNAKIGFSLKNLQILNAPHWFVMEGLGGHVIIDNISGTPFGGTCFKLDRISEATYINNINIWKFGGTATSSNDLAIYNNANTIVFDLGFVDALNISNVTTYNVKTSFRFYNNGLGAPWVNINNFNCDNNTQAFEINDFGSGSQITNGVIIGDVENTLDGRAPLLITELVSKSTGCLTISNVTIYNAAHGVAIKAHTGTILLSNINIKTDINDTGAGRCKPNNIRGAAIIDEGRGALVSAAVVGRGGRKAIEGIFGAGETLEFDGMILPNRGQFLKIINITKANPAVVTYQSCRDCEVIAGHKFRLTDILGMGELNNITATIANPTATTFELSSIDSTLYTTYTSGGKGLMYSDLTSTTNTPWEDKDNWINNTNISNITNGLKFDIAQTIVDSTFSLGATISQEAIGVIEFELNQTSATAIASAAKFDLSIIDANGVEITKMLDSGFVPLYQQGFRFIFAFFTNPTTDNRIKISFGGQPSGAASIDLTNLRIFRPDRDFITQTFIDKVYGTKRYTSNLPKFLQMSNANKVILGTSTPTAGNWLTGDKIKNLNPVAAGFEGWICITPGTPGIWKTYGAIGT